MSEMVEETNEQGNEAAEAEETYDVNELAQAKLALAEAQKRAKEAERKASALEREKLSDTERKEAEANEARERADRAEGELRRMRVEAVAASQGAVDPEVVASLLHDPPEDRKDIERAVKQLLREKPYLVRGKTSSDDVDAGAGGGDRPRDFNETIRRGFGR